MMQMIDLLILKPEEELHWFKSQKRRTKKFVGMIKFRKNTNWYLSQTYFTEELISSERQKKIGKMSWNDWAD